MGERARCEFIKIDAAGEIGGVETVFVCAGEHFFIYERGGFLAEDIIDFKRNVLGLRQRETNDCFRIKGIRKILFQSKRSGNGRADLPDTD